MKKRMWFAMVVGICALALVPGGFAQEQYRFDNDADPNNGFPTDATVDVGQDLVLYVAIENADRLLGYSFDVVFDATNYLELVSVRETYGDLNFDGKIDLSEISQAVDMFGQNASGTPLEDLVFNDPNTPDDDQLHVGVILDANANGVFDLDEVSEMVDTFGEDASGLLTYWTRVAADRAGWNESVEVYDPPSVSNVGGEHPGLVDDLTAVLLARPDRVVAGTRPGFGMSGNLCLCKVRLQALAAGSTQVDFGTQKIIIREDFQSVDIVGEGGLITIGGVNLPVTIN